MTWQEELNHISYRNSRSLSSRQSGYSFGRLFYLSRPRLGEGQLWQLIRGLSITNGKIDVPAYAIGFYYGYASQVLSHEHGNLLPEHPRKVELEKMGKISQAVTKAQKAFPQAPFCKMSTLADLGSVFCIKRIRKVEGNFGPQWYVLLMLDEYTSQHVETTEDNIVAVSIPCSKDGQSQRDMVLTQLQEDLPTHCGTFEAIPTEKGNPYINLTESPAEVCPCGVVSDEMSDEDTVDVFLDGDEEVVVPLEQAGKFMREAATGFNGKEKEEASVPFVRKQTRVTQAVEHPKRVPTQSTQKGVDFSPRKK